MNVTVKLTESASVITGHGETLYFKVLSGGPGIQRCNSMHAMLGYLQLYAHKDNHPLALKSPDSTQFLSGLILDFKGTKKVDILHYSLAIDNDLHKRNRNTLKKITNNSLSKGEMFTAIFQTFYFHL